MPDGAQGFAGGEETGADSADWDIEDGRKLGVGVAFDLAQPEKGALLGGQLAKKVGHDRGCFGSARSSVLDVERVSGFVPASVFRGLFAGDAVEPRAQGAAFGVEAMGATPDVGVGILHDILGRLLVAGEVTKEGA